MVNAVFRAAGQDPPGAESKRGDDDIIDEVVEEVDEEAVFLASARFCAPYVSLPDVIGASPDAFFLVTASLPAGARARAAPRPAPTCPPHSAPRARRR